LQNSPLILDGKVVAADVKNRLKDDIATLLSKNIVPGLTAILVGEDPASQVYVRSKERQAKKLGLHSDVIRLDAHSTQAELLAIIHQLNNDAKVHGILVQLPLPSHFDEDAVIEAINPEKDVDGFHPISVGRMQIGLDSFISCTPAGVLEILDYYKIVTSGKHVVVIGRSNIVGKPMANLLTRKGKRGDATVTVCHSRTPNMALFTRQADIIIAAVGVPELITADMIKDDVVIVDVGINRVGDAKLEKGYKLVGDVDYQSVLPKVKAITPVPGGVGVMTIAMLLSNTVKAAKKLSL
jgi:methylenetetrahydrofolate dehydrogenase (NADP+) / methenyltetrahydrofolate cyclohydrolase